MIAIDHACPVNWSHSLNRRLAFWALAGCTGRTGGEKWYDIAFNRIGTLTSMDPKTDWVTTSRPGGTGALDFDGSNDHVRFADFLSGGDELSASCWTKHSTSAASNQFMICQYDSGANQRSWALQTNNAKFQVLISTAGTAAQKIYTSTQSINTSTWRHVAMTFSPNVLRMYIDGAEITPTKNTDNTCNTLHNSTAQLVLGSFLNSGSATGFYPGQIDDLRVWNRTLSPNEIWEVYKNSRMGYPGLINRIDRATLAKGPSFMSAWAARTNVVISGVPAA